MPHPRVAIIHYGLGNLRSVENAFAYIGADVFIAETPADLADASHVVLPGVGAFGDGMANLRANGWDAAMHNHAVIQQKPLLGICLGMQLLAERGTEYGDHTGLGFIKGSVEKIIPTDDTIRIPHIGWNRVEFTPGVPMYAGLSAGDDYYFVHSYALKPENPAQITGICNHGIPFAASVADGAIWGAQFHPEKSQHAGLTLLRNFLRV